MTQATMPPPAKLPELALSVRQPWAWAIVSGWKDVENREWKPRNPALRFRGTAFIHAGLRENTDNIDDVIDMVSEQTNLSISELKERYERERRLGGIVGMVEFTGWTVLSRSRWFFGPYALLIRNAQPLPFMPCKGKQGFFRPDLSAHAEQVGA